MTGPELTKRKVRVQHQTRHSPFSRQNNGGKKSLAWDAWNPRIPGNWKVEKGDYWEHRDRIWRPNGLRGPKLTEQLMLRIEEQVDWLFAHPDRVREMREAVDLEAAVETIFARNGNRGRPMWGTVRRAEERIRRVRLCDR